MPSTGGFAYVLAALKASKSYVPEPEVKERVAVEVVIAETAKLLAAVAGSVANVYSA